MDKKGPYSDYTIKILLSESLAKETQRVVWLLRNEPHNPQSGIQAVDLLREAAEINLRFYFTDPAKALNAGSVSIKVLIAGVNTVIKLMSSIGYRFVNKLSVEQLGLIADFV